MGRVGGLSLATTVCISDKPAPGTFLPGDDCKRFRSFSNPTGWFTCKVSKTGFVLLSWLSTKTAKFVSSRW